MSLTINTNRAAVQAALTCLAIRIRCRRALTAYPAESGSIARRTIPEDFRFDESFAVRSIVSTERTTIYRTRGFVPRGPRRCPGGRRSDRRPNDRTQGNESRRHEEQLRQRDLRERVPRSSDSGARHGSANLQRRKLVRHDDSQDRRKSSRFQQCVTRQHRFGVRSARRKCGG